MAYPKNCPYCKKGTLSIFDSTPTSVTLTCSDCDKLIAAKSDIGKILEVAVPALSALASLASICAVLGITGAGKSNR